MWTDGRYFLQASQQMDNNWTLMKMGKDELVLTVGVSKRLLSLNASLCLISRAERDAFPGGLAD